MDMTWCYATLALRAHEYQESRCSCDAFHSRFCSSLHIFPHWMWAPYPICFLGKPHFWSDGCSSTFALFLFRPPTWLALKLHGPPVLPRNNTPVMLRMRCRSISTAACLNHSPIVVHLITNGLVSSTIAVIRALSSLPEGHDSVTNLSWFATLKWACHADFNVD